MEGRSLLDIGGGIGAIQHEMAKRGAAGITDVDASSAYLATARAMSERHGYGERASYIQGDFVELAHGVPRADLVTLDKVVCCYPDAHALLAKAAEKARVRLALVWPRDLWWTRLVGRLLNTGMWVLRNPFRMRIHPDRVVHGALEKAGLSLRRGRSSGFWQIALYERDGEDAVAAQGRPRPGA